MISCPKCHKENPNNNRFCTNCGSSLFYPSKSFLRRNWGCLLASFISLSLVGIGLISIFAIIGTAVSVFEETPGENRTVLEGEGENTIALVNLDGVILENEAQELLGTLADEVTSSRKLRKIFRELKSDKSIKAVILRINSPGGSAVASEEIYQDLKKYKAETKIPVIAYISDLAASGGYYIASQADTIIANPSAITGSIGVIISMVNLTDLAQNYGIESIVYKSGPYKDIGNALRKPNAEENIIMQSLVDDAYDVFLQRVSEGRNLPLEEVRKIADGSIFSSTQALQDKLIDTVGTFDTAITQAQHLANIKSAKIIEYGQPTFWELFSSTISKPFENNLASYALTFLSLNRSPKLLYLYAP